MLPKGWTGKSQTSSRIVELICFTWKIRYWFQHKTWCKNINYYDCGLQS